MADSLFVPQTVLDKWSEQGRVQVEGNVLTILGEGTDFELTAAVRFIRMEAGSDTARLLQKVKTTEALRQMGAEQYLESVILGECAYAVQQGFLADANALRRAAQASQPPPAPPAHQAASAPPLFGAAAAPADPTAGEGNLLAQFLLDNLR